MPVAIATLPCNSSGNEPGTPVTHLVSHNAIRGARQVGGRHVSGTARAASALRGTWRRGVVCARGQGEDPSRDKDLSRTLSCVCP